MANRKGTLKLYGEINSWSENSAGDFIARFEAEAAKADEIELHIHSVGGDVFEGNLIYNTIKKSKKPVDAYIDGVCASMASIVMIACRRVYMSENAFLMIHAPSGFVSGTASEMERSAKVLRDMENIFKKVYSAKTGKTVDEVSAWMNGDNWFAANDAFDAKLIDGVVDRVDETFAPEKETKNETAASLYARYAALSNKNLPKEQKRMNKQEIIDKFGLAGVTAESSEADIIAALEKKMNAADTAKAEAEKKLKDFENGQIEAKAQAAIDGGKFATKDKEMLVSIGKTSGLQTLESVIAAVKQPPTITGMLSGKQTGNTIAARADWTWDEWQAKDAPGLEALAESDTDAFKALYKTKFGVEAPL